MAFLKCIIEGVVIALKAILREALGIISESWSIYFILLEDSRVGVLVCDSHGVDVSYTSRTKYSHGVDVSYPSRT